jgi:biopolymer transport protein TolR
MAMGPVPAAEEGSYRPMAEINVTPLVDVMLVLLIIFMVAAPLMMVGVPVQLPQTSAAKVGQTKKPVVVSVTRTGEVYLREEPVPPNGLVQRLAALKAEAGDAVVYVRGDRGIEYGRVMTVLGQVGQAGFAKVSLIAEAQAGAPAP